MSLRAEDFLYTLHSTEQENWKLYFYDEFRSVFMTPDHKFRDDVWQSVKKYLTAQTASYRIQLTLRGVPFLVGFFFDKKEIRFYTPKLSQELFLLQQPDILDLKTVGVKDLRVHAEMAASLSVKNFPTTIELVSLKETLPDLFNESRFKAVDGKTNEIVKKLLSFLNEYRPSLFEDISDFGLGLTAQYALLRIHLLKFLAILPSLDHDKKGVEVKRILLESLSRFLKDNKKAKKAKKKGQERALSSTYTLGIKIGYSIALVIPAWILATAVRKTVRLMAKRFIAGESIEKAEDALKSLAQTNRDVTLDQLGELVVSEKEADHYKNEVLKLIKGFSLHVKKGDKNVAGINKAHVSIKVSAMCSDFKPHAPDYTYSLVAPRLKEVLLEAMKEDVFINIDAEHYHYRDIVFKIYKRVLLETPELSGFQSTGIVLQAYLRDAHNHLQEIIALARQRNLMMPIRIVKGAYWDAETVEGEAHSFDAPQFLNKEETDIHFRQLIVKILESHPHVQLAVASHNFSDHSFAEACRELLYPHAAPIEHQCLHMTYEALSTALAKMGWATRNYMPVGSLLVGMAYLVRRIMENSSQVGVLTIMRSHKKHMKLQSPYEIHSEKKIEGKIARDSSMSKLSDEFSNITPLRLYLDPDRLSIVEAIETFKKYSLGRDYENSFTLNGDWVSVHSSSNENELVGRIRFANLSDAETALKTIDDSYNSGEWANSKWSFRTAMLVKAASLMLCKRNELAALIMYEAGKTVSEALGDVDEAIDFLNFYARTEAYLQRNHTNLTSRGPSVIVAPWNFPLAIPCGMVVSSLVAGNTVILKSAEQTPLIAQILIDLLHSAGVPKNVLIHLPGEGETIGDFLIKDERISTIIFTGSKAVGTYIHGIAKKRVYKNSLINKVYPVKAITEMGGKNAVIVTQNAELDETVSGILYSAFGHAGQKCSACSRVIVHESLKSKLIERLRDACADLKIGSALNFETFVNPIISKEDKERLKKAAIEATKEAAEFGGTVVIDRSSESVSGHVIGPVVIELPYERGLNKESYSQRELFGPFVHILGFSSLDEAVTLYNSTDYALTGGIFSQSQNDIDYLVSKLENGNIYINRTITGARVAIEPFGGFKLSGTGPKAGGKDYLISLHQSIDLTSVQNSSKDKIDNYIIEEGIDFSLELSRPSKLSVASKQERMEKFLDIFTSSFESFYQGIFFEYKESLRDYKKWVSKKYPNFVELDHKNRTIPGQLSFNNYQLFAETAVCIAHKDRPNLKTLIQVFSCVNVGTGLTIMARNKKSYHWWQNVAKAFYEAGFSKENIKVTFPNQQAYVQSLTHSKISVVIYDGEMENYLADVAQYFSSDFGKTNDERMKLILTSSDVFSATDFYHQALNYVWVRSMAVNTMRHGAPLDLEIG